ncbi:MAG: hypothetical protein AB7I18_04850 [Candidatus Berkiella sp.]
MTASGPTIDLNSKYSADEQSKFGKIVDAHQAKNVALVKQLMSGLDKEEVVRFKAYFADLAEIQKQYKAQVAAADASKARYEARMQNVSRLDSEISGLQAQRAAVFSNGARAAVGEIKAEFRGTPTPGTAPAPQGRLVTGLKY